MVMDLAFHFGGGPMAYLEMDLEDLVAWHDALAQLMRRTGGRAE